LYVSDLDGTLLNSNKEFSAYTKSIINDLAEKGIPFTVATARTQASSLKILKDVKINYPVIFMNGVVIYDINNDSYIRYEAISPEKTAEVIRIFRRNETDGFMYTISNNSFDTYYEKITTDAMLRFYNERVNKYYKKFTKTNDLLKTAEKCDVVYFTVTDEYKRLIHLYNELKRMTGINVELYRDIYTEKLWYLEIFSDSASKYTAVSYLRKKYNFEYVIGFGDNLNDIALFKACDEGYAVLNADEALKSSATAIIGDHNSDGVMRFIAERENLKPGKIFIG